MEYMTCGQIYKNKGHDKRLNGVKDSFEDQSHI